MLLLSMCLASPARAFPVDKTSGAGAPDSCPRKVWIPSPSSGVCPVVAARAFTRLNASEHPVGRQQTSDAKDSSMKVDHRDVPGCLCPSGVAGIGVFVFR